MISIPYTVTHCMHDCTIILTISEGRNCLNLDKSKDKLMGKNGILLIIHIRTKQIIFLFLIFFIAAVLVWKITRLPLKSVPLGIYLVIGLLEGTILHRKSYYDGHFYKIGEVLPESLKNRGKF